MATLAIFEPVASDSRAQLGAQAGGEGVVKRDGGAPAQLQDRGRHRQGGFFFPLKEACRRALPEHLHQGDAHREQEHQGQRQPRPSPCRRHWQAPAHRCRGRARPSRPRASPGLSRPRVSVAESGGSRTRKPMMNHCTSLKGLILLAPALAAAPARCCEANSDSACCPSIRVMLVRDPWSLAGPASSPPARR